MGCVLFIALSDAPSAPRAAVKCRILGTREFLLSAPTLERWGWDFHEYVFNTFGYTPATKDSPEVPGVRVLARRPNAQPYSGRVRGPQGNE